MQEERWLTRRQQRSWRLGRSSRRSRRTGASCRSAPIWQRKASGPSPPAHKAAAALRCAADGDSKPNRFRLIRSIRTKRASGRSGFGYPTEWLWSSGSTGTDQTGPLRKHDTAVRARRLRGARPQEGTQGGRPAVSTSRRLAWPSAPANARTHHCVCPRQPYLFAHPSRAYAPVSHG